MLSACCRTFRNTKNNGLEGFSLYAAKMQRKKVFSTKAQAGRCLAHGHYTRFPLWRLLLQSSYRAESSGEMQPSLSEISMPAAPFPLVHCPGQLWSNASESQARQTLSFTCGLRVVIFRRSARFHWTHPTLVVFAKGFDLALRGPPPPPPDKPLTLHIFRFINPIGK